ncbi:MAG: glycine cleavage system protein R [Myxococcales bacterium]
MKTSLVITFTGPDRPGIVEALSKVVAGHGGNWERSRMARLAGRFAGILEITIREGDRQKLAAELERIAGLHVFIDRNEPSDAVSGDRRLRLDLTGQDRPGIVREIATALAKRGVNIEDLSTESGSAPMSGEQLFHARLELRCPPGLDVAELRRAIERLSDDLVAEISLTEK